MKHSPRLDSMKPAPAKAVRGRPRAFDADAALEKAMHVFWKHGFEGTSLDALTDAMGINRPSLYAAFGNKESLFRKIVERYSVAACGQMQAALAQPTARQVVEALLLQSLGSAEAQPAGCLLVQGALACSEAAEPMQDELTAKREASRVLLQKRFERAVKEGDLPADAKPSALARYLQSVMHGLSIQSASGATIADRRAVAEIALNAFPKLRKRGKTV